MTGGVRWLLNKSIDLPPPPPTTITIFLPNEDPTFIFPLQENTQANLEIDWGNGQQQAVATTTPAGNYEGIPHTYATGGVKEIKVTGTAVRQTSERSPFGIFFDSGTTGLNAQTNKNKVIGVNHLNDVIDEDMTAAPPYFLREMFYNCQNLVTAPEIPQSITTANARFLDSAFSGCMSLASLPANFFGALTTTGSSNKFLGSAFSGCTSLASIAADFLSGLTTINGTPSTARFLETTFSGCTSLTSIPASFLSSLTSNFYYTLNKTFMNCTNLSGNTPVDGSGQKLWNRFMGIYAGYVCFYNCTLLSDYASIPNSWK